MARRSRQSLALEDRGPLRVMFVITSMPVGGAETLLVNLVRRLDRERFSPSLACLKAPGPLGEELAGEIPVFSNLIGHKFDVNIAQARAVVQRAADRRGGDRRRRRQDVLGTRGSALGRRAGRAVGLALDGLARLDRPLKSLAIAHAVDRRVHRSGRHTRSALDPARTFSGRTRCSSSPTVSTSCGFIRWSSSSELRRSLGIAEDSPVAGIVAALRPEKNHELFLRAPRKCVESCATRNF